MTDNKVKNVFLKRPSKDSVCFGKSVRYIKKDNGSCIVHQCKLMPCLLHSHKQTFNVCCIDI